MPTTIHLGSIDSTNNYLKKLLQDSSPKEATLVYTDFQTGGRGQQGNSWQSQEGENLLFSLLLYPTHIKANEQFVLSQLVSLAIKEVLDEYTDNISIKWPNDIYYQEKKIGGILIENGLIEETIQYSILGIGLNINQKYFDNSLPNPVSLTNITQEKYYLPSLLKKISEKITEYYKLSKTKNIEYVGSIYKKALLRKEGYHLYRNNKETFLAEIADVTPMGMLGLRKEDDEIYYFAFKEVEYIF